MIKISSELRQVSINPLGAELASIVATESGEEFMWSGDAAYWSGRAPILFPIIGELRNGSMQAKNASWSMSRHGIVRKRMFDCEKVADNQLQCTIESDQETLTSYPWRFRLAVTFTIDADELRIDYLVHNLDSDSMLFNLGSHPAFSLPLKDARLADYRIRFNKPESLNRHLLKDNLLQRESKAFALEDNTLRMSQSLFDEDALVFRHINSSELSLEYAPLDSEKPFRRVSVDTGGAPHLGIWAKPGAPYVCIEPWWGHADFEDASGHFPEKSSIQTLDPGDVFAHRLGIKTFDTAECQ